MGHPCAPRCCSERGSHTRGLRLLSAGVPCRKQPCKDRLGILADAAAAAAGAVRDAADQGQARRRPPRAWRHAPAAAASLSATAAGRQRQHDPAVAAHRDAGEAPIGHQSTAWSARGVARCCNLALPQFTQNPASLVCDVASATVALATAAGDITGHGAATHRLPQAASNSASCC